ncbi:Nn.00g023780.m01.CDS01 [Neocucurbitaria sp. VM-36]
MPRPPRAKVALSTTRVSKPKSAPRKQQTKATTTQARKASETVDNFSDDSDGLVTKSQSTRPRRRMPWEKTPELVTEAELTMTGALPAHEEAPVPSTKNRTPTVNASKKEKTRSSARTSARRASPSTSIPSQSRSPVVDAPEELGQADESSGFGDLTFSSLGSDSPAHGTRPPSAIKVGATPAHERSILALTNFKRRARQPSLLRMVQQTTDLEDNDRDNLDSTDSLEFDDFLPHAESTPLNVKRSVPEEDARADSGTQISSSGSRGTKRKLSPVVQVPRSSPPFSPPSGADVESGRSPSPSLPDILATREETNGQAQDGPELFSETFAPPKSSSLVREVSQPPQSPIQTRLRRRGRQAKTPIIDDGSEAEETETPAKTRRGAKKKAQQSISTAQLKGLLPRRRNRMRDRDEFDLESSDEVTQMDSDQDELQMPERRNRQRPGPGKLASPKATKKVVRGKKTLPTKATQKASRTYSRRISSDKENDTASQDNEEIAEISAIEHSEKLAAIRKKFEEVDAFELEFETVDVTTSSSPFR